MPNKYNEINRDLIDKRAWKALVYSLTYGGYIFQLPDALAIDSLQVTIAQANKDAEFKYHITMNSDKRNLGVSLTVSPRND